MRAVSTVADTLVFLLLVSAAVATLVVSPSAPTPPRADPTAETLATTTLSVPLQATDGTDHQRTASGTPAGLLGRAALANATLDGRRLLPGSFPRRVALAVHDARPVANVRVVARWRPYPGASLSGRVAAGSPAPRDAVTDVAVVTVPSGIALDTDRARAAADDGFRPLARTVAERFVARLFPPGAGRSNLGTDAARARTAPRYRRFAAVVGAEVRGPLANRSATTARDRLADALAARLTTDMRRRFESPRRAAAALTLDTVRLAVVRWR
ncbi:hypothetical protein ACFPYI_04750 [Halomarina salina]|uniref:DUF4129 domain-containing protein n=1 Tax=Halomarina salina TaxID=1872699 RepID=A0ABD5RJP0_9EURY|nr:hypothetical protein [Halomarina salina]